MRKCINKINVFRTCLCDICGGGIGRRAGFRKRGDGIAIVHHARCKSLPTYYK